MNKCSFLNHSIIANMGIYNNITIMENTIESIMYAVKNNLSVKIDVRVTKDNELIVFHDEDACRLIKLKDKINSLTYEELNYISNYHIPTLKEVLNSINSKVPVVIEVKDDNKIIRTNLINVLNGYKGDFVVLSKDYSTIRFYKKNKYIVGLVIDKNNKNLINKELRVEVLSIKYDLIDKLKAKELKSNYYLIGYTINTREYANYYIKIFNNLIIDNIEEVFK
ncbi:MAG: hypothetical protein IJD92_00310 [Bacilli bacterium]|nr:hypothetical protein [Bacilli bacterium]